MARFSGNLAATRTANVPALPDNTRNWGEGVDARHGDPNIPDLGQPPPAPHVKLEVPPFIEDMVTLTREPPYFPLEDPEPAEFDDKFQHDVSTLPYGVPDNDRLRQMSGQLHGIRKGVYPYLRTTKVARDFTTKNETRREQSLPGLRQDGALSGFALRALRGFNSLPVNNPGSPDVSYSGNYVRQGWDISRITNRRMPRRGLTHVKRELHVNVAATAVDTPPHAGPYSSPFRNFGRWNVRAYMPSLRREPEPWDQDAADDYAQEQASNYNSWGL